MSADQNTFRILVATDIHLGFQHFHPVRKEDSLKTFEEILQQAHQHHADFLLLGGDLFHDNRPPRPVLMDCMNLLKTYCLHDDDGVEDPHRGGVNGTGDSPRGATGSHVPGPKFRVLRGVQESASSLDVDGAEGGPTLAPEAAVQQGRQRRQGRHNVSLPVFAIHGNHDEPTGPRQLSVLDVLDTAGLLTYFGKVAPPTPHKQLQVKPLLLQKGSSRLALYGLGYVRSNKLSQKFQNGGVLFVPPDAGDEPLGQDGGPEEGEGRGETEAMESEDLEGEEEEQGETSVGQAGEEDADDHQAEEDQPIEQVDKFNIGEEGAEDWFRLLVLHQNRIHRPRDDTHIEEDWLEGLADLVIWGHEHECKIRPVQTRRGPAWRRRKNNGGSVGRRGRAGRTWISQPGSSIATQFSKHEQKQKFIGLLEICGKSFSIRKIPLLTPRQMYVHDLEWGESESLLEDACAEIVANLLNRAESDKKPHNPKEPLIRIKVSDSKSFDQFSNARFGKQFLGRVANPESIVVFGTKRGNADGGGSGYTYPKNTDTALFSVQQLFEKELVEAGGLQLLRESEGFRSAVEDYVRFADRNSASERVIDVFSTSLTDAQRRIKDDLTLADQDGENAVHEYLRKTSTGLDAGQQGPTLSSQVDQTGSASAQPTTPAPVDVAYDDDVIIVSVRAASDSALRKGKAPAVMTEQSPGRAASVSLSSSSSSSPLTSNSAAKSTKRRPAGEVTGHSTKPVSQQRNLFQQSLIKSASTPASSLSVRSSTSPPSSPSASSSLPCTAVRAKSSNQSPSGFGEGKLPVQLSKSSSALSPSMSPRCPPSSAGVSAAQPPSSSSTAPATVRAAAGLSCRPRKHNAATPAGEPPTKLPRCSSFPSSHNDHGPPESTPRSKSPSTLLSEGATLRRRLTQQMIDAPRSGTPENCPKTTTQNGSKAAGSVSAPSGRFDAAISAVRRQLEFPSAGIDKSLEVIVVDDDDFQGFLSEDDDLLDSDGLGEWELISSPECPGSVSSLSGQTRNGSATVCNGGLNRGRSKDDAPGVTGVAGVPGKGALAASVESAPDLRTNAGTGNSVLAGRLEAGENEATTTTTPTTTTTTPAPAPEAEECSSQELDEAYEIIRAGDDFWQVVDLL